MEQKVTVGRNKKKKKQMKTKKPNQPTLHFLSTLWEGLGNSAGVGCAEENCILCVVTSKDIVANDMQLVLPSEQDRKVKLFDGKALNIILQNIIL